MQVVADAARQHVTDAIATFTDMQPGHVHPLQAFWLAIGGAMTAVADAAAYVQTLSPGLAANIRESLVQQFEGSFDIAMAHRQGTKQ